jgi:hypothetical protein
MRRKEKLITLTTKFFKVPHPPSPIPMKRLIRFVCSTSSLGLMISNASAVVLSFDGAGSMQDLHSSSYVGIGDTYTQGGFTMTVGPGQHYDQMDANGLYWHNGPANDNYDSWATLTLTGGNFDLNSFQLNNTGAEIRTNLNPSPVTFAAGTHVVNLTNLSWVQFSPLGNGLSDGNPIYLDNVNVSASVPEPSITLLGGAALFCSVFRRRR